MEKTCVQLEFSVGLNFTSPKFRILFRRVRIVSLLGNTILEKRKLEKDVDLGLGNFNVS